MDVEVWWNGLLQLVEPNCRGVVHCFTDSYDNIRQHAIRYSETGSTATPPQGRGKRVAKKNARYFSSWTDDDINDDDDNIDDPGDDNDAIVSKGCRNQVQ